MDIVKKISVFAILAIIYSCIVRTFGAKGEDGKPGGDDEDDQIGRKAKLGKDAKDGADAAFHLIVIPLKKDKPVKQDDSTAKKKTEKN